MSCKSLDKMGRHRSKNCAFRVSPEEWEWINMAVALSGLPKQDFLLSKILDRTIVVQGNCKVHRAVYDKLNEVLESIKKIESPDQYNEELSSDVKLITQVIRDLYTKAP